MNRAKKILIIRNAYQQDAGGAEQYALNLSIALKKMGHKPILVTKVKKIHDKCGAEGINVISGPWHNTQKWDRWYYFRYPLFTLWYMWVIVRHRIDVVHPQSRDDFVFATRAAKLLRKQVVWTDHADLKYILDNVNHYNPRMRGWIIRASNYTKAIICASHNEKSEIESVAPELSNLTVIYNGVFVPTSVNPVDKTNQIIIGTNARLVEAKGIGELLDGFAALNRKDADLWLLGGASGNRSKYENIAKRLGIYKQLKIWDYVPRPDDVVASMDIFVHASYHEAFSLAIIEAAMLGRPIVATNVGGTPEIIDEACGILIDPKNSSAIANALGVLIKDEGLRLKLGEAVRKKALTHFDFEKIVKSKIIPLYKESR